MLDVMAEIGEWFNGLPLFAGLGICIAIVVLLSLGCAPKFMDARALDRGSIFKIVANRAVIAFGILAIGIGFLLLSACLAVDNYREPSADRTAPHGTTLTPRHSQSGSSW